MAGSQICPPAVHSVPMRVAVVQAAPVLFDTPKSLQKCADLACDAAKQGAELVVFPEAFIGGYPKGHDFGVSVGIRSSDGRDEFRRLYESAVEIPGPETGLIGSVARDHAIHLVVGVVEREGGTLFCTALIFGPDGQVLGKHRKLMPTAMERVIWGSGDGSTLPVVTTKLGKIGSVICWENYMPLLRTTMYAKGIELYCAITVDDRDTWIPTVRHIALEGRCFVLSACQFLQRSDLSSSYPTERIPVSQDVLIRGGSCIVGPLGGFLAGPVYGEESVITASLDRADLARAKIDFDVVGHYARPDVFRLEVNEQPMKSVVFTPAHEHALASHDSVWLRPVQPGDLPRMYDMQLDSESNRMAVTIPRPQEAFGSHWAKVLGDPGNTARAILAREVLVGYISCFPMDGQDHVGYWIDRAYWGLGIASRALQLLLQEVANRPLVATAATSNGASIRVLQKCGFVVEQVQLSPASDRYPECEVAILVLR